MGRNSKWELLHKYLSGELNEEEERRFREWIEENPERKGLVKELKRIWDVVPPMDVHTAWLAFRNREVQEAAEKRGGRSPRSESATDALPAAGEGRSHWKLVTGMAVLLLMLTSFFTLYLNPPVQMAGEGGDEQISMKTMVTKKGEKARVTFNDGTKVIMNASSTLRFPSAFTRNKQVVRLEGEAYFEVAPRSNSRFIVKTGQADVMVHGTQFNVNTQPEKRNFEVVVKKGRVSVSPRTQDRDKSLLLEKNERTVMNPDGRFTEPVPVDSRDHIAWIYDGFHFDDTPFPEVIKALEQRFGVDIEVEQSHWEHVGYSGAFKGKSLEEILDIISQSLNFSYKRNKDTIFIYRESGREGPP